MNNLEIELSKALVPTIVFVIAAFLNPASQLTANEYLTPEGAIAGDQNVLTVTAEFEETSALELAASVSVVDQETIVQRNAQHFSELLNLTPNVNFATGASRGRFVQIRGIGERSEFSEPVNYSVGVVVDGIDMTGIASAATLLDIAQVEILRGPQGTLYGANALAGLINVVSNDPDDTFSSRYSGSLESFGGRSLSAVISDSLSAEHGYRIALGQYQSDGVIDNLFLNRDDTNNIDESSLRGKWVYQPRDDFAVTTSLFFADIDNGYDAFSLDSTRQTYSDQPGVDAQQTRAFSIQLEQELATGNRLQLLISGARSALEYAYDEDWSNPGICDGTDCDSALWGFDWWYASYDQYLRDNDNISLDFRLLSQEEATANSWVAGVYVRDQVVDLNRQYTYLSESFNSQYQTLNSALYGQYSASLSDNLTLTGGLRLERWRADYNDSDAAVFSPTENLWGGKLSLVYQYERDRMLYALISRGYKPGGFNTDGTLSVEQREFNTEFMWNYEAGVKGYWLQKMLRLRASAFYQDRKDVQTKQSIVRSLDDGLTLVEGGVCPCSFTDYIDNAASSESYGVEVEADYSVSDDLAFYFNLGLLKARFKDFASFTHVDADPANGIWVDLGERDQAQSPNYQVALGSNYYLDDNWRVNAEIEAKDAYYFSDRHDEKSDAYALLNLRLSYTTDNWQLNFYANNLFDKDIQTRGFGSFGNDPRKFYAVEPYYQFAAPRVIGLSASVEFE